MNHSGNCVMNLITFGIRVIKYLVYLDFKCWDAYNNADIR